MTVALGMDNVPEIVLPVPASVYTPLAAVKVPLLAILPLTVIASLTLALQVPDEDTVRSVNVFVPVALVIFKVPLMVVAPLITGLALPMFRVGPLKMVSAPFNVTLLKEEIPESKSKFPFTVYVPVPSIFPEPVLSKTRFR